MIADDKLIAEIAALLVRIREERIDWADLTPREQALVNLHFGWTMN